MKKVYTKMLLTLTALLVSTVLVVSVSYAWMVLSNNPVAEGIQITIGGGNTILIAPDQTHTSYGKVYHYPGEFDGTLNFSESGSYDYLSEISGLTPVSTADGINWFLPTYYDLMDPEVQNGTVLSGTMKSVDKFILDKTLSYANLDSSEGKLAAYGSYVYVDFWVVSPGDDYTLRVSTGDDFGGSYVIGLPQAVEAGEGYTLAADSGNTAASVRVGLLADSEYITDDTMWYYQNSSSFSPQYSRLRGSYTEPGSDTETRGRFTVYEPNGDVHPTNAGSDGKYLITRPLGLVDGAVTAVNIADRLTVQTENSWAAAQTGEGTQLEQRFQTALFEPSFDNLSVTEITQKFYSDYLGSSVMPYVSAGWFVKNTQNLYANESSGSVDASFLSDEYTAGATDDVFIVQLEKNVPQRIRMFIWLEGQDADCVNSAEASSVAVRIELAGSHMGAPAPVVVQTPDTSAETDDENSENTEIQTDDSAAADSTGETPSDSGAEESVTEGELQSDTLDDTEADNEEPNE